MTLIKFLIVKIVVNLKLKIEMITQPVLALTVIIQILTKYVSNVKYLV